MDFKILQLMPAVGWCAFYQEDDGERFCDPIACFALIEEMDPLSSTPYQLVVPMVPDGRQLTRADEASNFVEIRYVPDFKPEA